MAKESAYESPDNQIIPITKMHEDPLESASTGSEPGGANRVSASKMKIVDSMAALDDNLNRSKASNLSFGYQSKAIVHENSLPTFHNPYEELTEQNLIQLE